MNKVILAGRLVRDPEVRYSAGDNPMAIARYTVAVDRRAGRTETETADFISCVAFGNRAEFAEKYLRKGIKIALTGHIQTGSYTNKDGVKVYTTEVVIEECEFAESKGKNEEARQNESDRAAMVSDMGDGFMNIPDGMDEELSFN